MKKAIVAAIVVAFFVSTAAEARGGRGFSGGRSFSRPAPTKSYAPKRTTVVKKNYDRHQPDGSSVLQLKRWRFLVEHGRIGRRRNRRFNGGQCDLRFHDEGRQGTAGRTARTTAGHLRSRRSERKADPAGSIKQPPQGEETSRGFCCLRLFARLAVNAVPDNHRPTRPLDILSVGLVERTRGRTGRDWLGRLRSWWWGFLVFSHQHS